MGTISLSLDYLYFLHGFVWLLLVAPAVRLARLHQQPAWRPFAWFTACATALLWSKIFLIDGGDQPAFAALRFALQSAAILFLFEFVRLAAVVRGKGPIAPWIHSVPVVLIILAIKFAPFDAAITVRVFGLTSAMLLASGVLLHLSASLPPSSRRRWRIAALGMGASAGACAITIAADRILAGSVVQTAPRNFDFWIALLRLVCAALCALPIASDYDVRYLRELFGERQRWLTKRELSWISALSITLLAGWFATEWIGKLRERDQQENVLQRVRMAASAIDPDLAQQLQGTAADVGTPAYSTLKLVLRSIAKNNPDLQVARLVRIDGDQVEVLIDSTDFQRPKSLAPDPLLSGRPALEVRSMADESASSGAPPSPHGGAWVRAMYPLFSYTAPAPTCALIIDFSATGWYRTTLHGRLPAVLITLLVSSLLLTSFRAQWRIRQGLYRLAASEQHNRNIVEGSPNCVQVVDTRGRCVRINRFGLNALGCEEVDVVGLDYLKPWPEEARGPLAAALTRAFGGARSTLELDFVRPDQRVATFRITLSPLFDAHGNVESIISIGVDITERKQYERALVKAKEIAEASTHAKSDFLAVISHEIRTPLGGVIGMLDLLRKQTQSPQQRHYTDLAHQSASALIDLLNDLLDAAKIEAGRLMLEPVVFRPRAELGRVVECMRPRAMMKNLELTSTFDDDVPDFIKADPTRLRQVLNNLLSNALKFTPHGSVKVLVTAQRREDGRVALCIAVKDTGTGMSPAVQAKLFSKFEQGDASVERRFGGTGLGLAITKHIVEQMDGDIAVQSEVGRGSTFTCRVLTDAVSSQEIQAATIDEKKSAFTPHSHRLRILCAEDEMINRIIVEGLVAAMGHTIEFADDGVDALEKLEAEKYDVVLMDNRMPRMDGVQATRVIRDVRSSVLDHDVFVVATTADASERHREEYRAVGMNHFVAKPFREDELHGALQQAIEFQQWRGLSLPPAETALIPPAPAAGDPSVPGLSEASILAMLGEDVAEKPSANSGAPFRPEMVRMYLRDAPARLEQIRRALRNADGESLGIAAHSIKNISQYVAAKRLSELGAELEAAADRGRFIESALLFSKLEAEFESVKLHLEISTRIRHETTSR